MNLKLRGYRESAGMTQQQLAKLIHKSFRTIQTWERGESFPNAEAVWDLCVLFGCDPNDLLGWRDDHPREEGAESFSDPWQGELNRCYEASTPDRKRRIVDTARDAALASENAAERDVDGLGLAGLSA